MDSKSGSFCIPKYAGAADEDPRRSPSVLCIHELFRNQAARTPDRAAIIFQDQRLTYADLDQLSDRIAADLQSRGIGLENVVAISSNRSPAMVASILGVLKAGAAYLPVDPSLPAERVEFMLRDSETKAVLTEAAGAARFAQSQVLAVDGYIAGAGGAAVRESGVTPENLAYLMYTSGSTGTPKGVMIEHRNVANFFAGMDDIVVTAPGVWLAVTSISFDISVFELLWTLTRGFTIVLLTDEEKLLMRGRYSLPEQAMRHGVTHLQCTPSFARILLRSPQAVTALRSLRELFVGGEALPPSLANELRSELTCTVHNMYGPTETTIWSTSCVLDPKDRTVSIGTPILNTTTYILDDEMHPLADGEVGELYIGGAGVARGYWNRSSLTLSKFLPDPFVSNPAERIYRTGDLASRRADGKIDFHGRTDHQVKIRGHRIELGEIESILGLHPGISETAVIAHETGSGDFQIAAYVVRRPGESATEEALRDYARNKLPDYIVPDRVAFLDRLPTTPNGKIDRNALPRPEKVGAAADSTRETRTELQELLTTMWKEALGLEAVGLNENFFDLGATSLTVAEVASSIATTLSREIRLTVLFQHPTIGSLADFLGGRSDGLTAPGATGADRGAARRGAMRRKTQKGGSEIARRSDAGA